MLPLHSVEMTRQRLNDSSRQDGWPIFLALASPNHNLPSFEIDVLHAQLQTFLQPQPGTIKESDDHPRDTIEILHRATSSRLRTTGTRTGMRARGTCSMGSMFKCSTSRYRNNTA